MNASLRPIIILLLCAGLGTALPSHRSRAQSAADQRASHGSTEPANSPAVPLPVDQIRSLIESAITEGKLPGAVVAVADAQRLLWIEAFGHRQLEPTSVTMTTETIFDLASLTKPIATATSVMALVEAGQVKLDAPAAEYLPEFTGGGKARVTVRDLLLHQSGLIADNSLRDYTDGPQQAWQRICQLELVASPGEKFIYSDVGFIVLGELVERVSGRDLAAFSRAEIFEPLGMSETWFNPPEPLRRRAAATEQRDGQWLVGRVHDPRAARLGGVAGHAGLFSTASDLVRFAQMLLRQTAPDSNLTDPEGVLSPETCRRMVSAHTVSRGLRGLGWDIDSPYSSNRGEAFSASAFGHGGFTGTVLWVDPEQQIAFVFLSSRLHPDGQGAVNRLAGRIATLIAQHVVPAGDSAP